MNPYSLRRDGGSDWNIWIRTSKGDLQDLINLCSVTLIGDATLTLIHLFRFLKNWVCCFEGFPFVFVLDFYSQKRHLRYKAKHSATRRLLKKRSSISMPLKILWLLCSSILFERCWNRSKAHPIYALWKTTESWYCVEWRREKFLPTLLKLSTKYHCTLQEYRKHQHRRHDLQLILSSKNVLNVLSYFKISCEGSRWDETHPQQHQGALRSREHLALPSGGGSNELWWPLIRPSTEQCNYFLFTHLNIKLQSVMNTFVQRA